MEPGSTKRHSRISTGVAVVDGGEVLDGATLIMIININAFIDSRIDNKLYR